MSDSEKSKKEEIKERLIPDLDENQNQDQDQDQDQDQKKENELSEEIPVEIEDTLTLLEEELGAKQKKIDELLLLAGREAEYLNALKYQQAEFENYKRRTEKEKQEFADRRLEYFIMDLLPIKDALEVAIEHTHTHTPPPAPAEEKTNSDGLLKGLEITLKQINELLEREGLEEIKAAGLPFDPFRHEIIAREIIAKGEEHQENTVIDVMRKGYLFRGRVIRPAMVKIAITEDKSKSA